MKLESSIWVFIFHLTIIEPCTRVLPCWSYEHEFFFKKLVVELVIVRFRGINLHVKFQLHDVHELRLNLKEDLCNSLFYGLSWRLDSTKKTI